MLHNRLAEEADTGAVLSRRSGAALAPLFQAGAFLLPLLWWGGLDDPFFTPKIWLLAVLDAALLWVCLRRGRGTLDFERASAWPWLAWIAAAALAAIFGRYVSLEGLLLVLLPLPLAWALHEGILPAGRIARALLWGSAAESAIAVLQYGGLDPLGLFWQPDLEGSPRMRVYGTLGNPNFVAAWLCATLPLYWEALRRPPRRLLWGAALVLHLAGIVATGSRVFLVAFPAMAAALLFADRRRAKWLLVGVPVAAALVWLSPARPLRETIEGRMYLAGVAASRWREIPPTGFGPGAFRMQFVPWQVERLRERGPDYEGRRFAGPVDHAHNDFVELLVEYGPAGLGAFLFLSGWLLWRAWPLGPAAAAVPAFLAIAMVDFPLHRAAEGALYWLLIGMCRRAPPELEEPCESGS